MNNVLEIIDLEKHFEEFKAVNGLSFNVKEGVFFSILGPSGCGKTTLLRMIAGFVEQSSGDLKIRNKDIK